MMSLFFQMAENLGAEYGWETEQRGHLGVHNGGSWQTAAGGRHTKGFVESGFIDFVGPDDFGASQKFTEERYWLRARSSTAGTCARRAWSASSPTRSRRARHLAAERDPRLLRRHAAADFSFSQNPLLEGEIIEVREREPPSGDALDELGDDPVRNASDEEGGGVWVRWKSVEASSSRVQQPSLPARLRRRQDPVRRRAARNIPQEGRNNIVARRYQVGGGGKGNVNSGR
jgi:hypothetical protein